MGHGAANHRGRQRKETARIDTNTPDRDAHLRSEDFFAVERFPTVTFGKAKDFGLLWNAALETGGFLVGDDVKISVSVQAAAAA